MCPHIRFDPFHGCPSRQRADYPGTPRIHVCSARASEFLKTRLHSRQHDHGKAVPLHMGTIESEFYFAGFFLICLTDCPAVISPARSVRKYDKYRRLEEVILFSELEWIGKDFRKNAMVKVFTNRHFLTKVEKRRLWIASDGPNRIPFIAKWRSSRHGPVRFFYFPRFMKILPFRWKEKPCSLKLQITMRAHKITKDVSFANAENRNAWAWDVRMKKRRFCFKFKCTCQQTSL